jgi:transcriptional regulator with XRE-family HTH domain
MSNTVTVINKTIPYILRPAFAKDLIGPTKDDINKLYTKISSEDKKKPTFLEKRSLMDYIATSVLGVGFLGGIVGYLKENKGLFGGAGVVAVAGIAGFVYKFVKTPALEKLTNIAETESADVKPEVDLSGEMSPEYEQWLIDVKKDIYSLTNYSDRIQELSKRNDLSDEEKAELAGLKEFPNNRKMAELIELENLELNNVTISAKKREQLLKASYRRNLNRNEDFFRQLVQSEVIPISSTEKTILESVRLIQRIHSGNLSASDQGMVNRLKRMLDTDKEIFLQDLDILLEKMPINLLMCNELFKDMLYQRYQVVDVSFMDTRALKLLRDTTGIPDSFEQPVLSRQKTLELLSEVEDRRQELLGKGKASISEYDPNKVKRDPPYVQGLQNRRPRFEDDLVYSNTTCQCVHGGGSRLLRLILTNKHPGNKLEDQEAKGLQVHPYAHKERIKDSVGVYSSRCERYFDTPSLLFFRVEARHLDAQQNIYEAGIRSEFLEHATDFRLENLITGEVLQGDTLKDIREAIAKSKIGIGDF